MAWRGSDESLDGGFTSRSSTWGFSPYAGWQFDEHWSGSLMVGVTSGSSTVLTRGSLGGSVSLPLTGWEPYVRTTGEHDFKVPMGGAPSGSSGATIGAGTTVTLTDAFDGGYNSLGRTGLSLWSVSAWADLRF